MSTRLIIGDELQAEDFDSFLDMDSTLIDAINQCAMFKASWETVIPLITEATASSLDESFGNLPIHYACANEAPQFIVQKLLDCFPSGSEVKDWQGKLPLHMALDCSDPDPGTINTLLNAYPMAATIQDDNGHTPIEVASRKLPNKESILYSLVAADLPYTQLGVENLSHGFSWSFFVDCPNVSTETCVAIVRRVFEAYPTLAERLAHSKDFRGRELLLIARPEVRTYMYQYLFLCGRYELVKGPPVHCTATSIVRWADDYCDGNPATRVALKFIRDKFHFEREIHARAVMTDDSDFIIRIIHTHDVEGEDRFRRDMIRLELADYKYCLVMEAGERTLKAIIDAERVCGRQWDLIRSMGLQLVDCLAYMHNHNTIHGDLKPLNIVRQNGALKLIDLDAAAYFSVSSDSSSPEQGQQLSDWAGAKSSTAYLPPELIYVCADGTVIVRSPLLCQGVATAFPRISPSTTAITPSDAGPQSETVEAAMPIRNGDELSSSSSYADSNSHLPQDSSEAQLCQRDLVSASPSLDMWSLGCVLFHLCAGEPLFLANDEDNLDQENMRQLLQFPFDRPFQSRKLQKISHPLARNLVAQLLNGNPASRPRSMQHVRAHPFFSGKAAGRMIGECSSYDVFLSYRVDSDSDLVELLYHKLQSLGLRVFWDKECLLPGVSWEEGFCDGLVKSRTFVPILSRAAIKSRFEGLLVDSPCDNVLLEYRLALELSCRGLVERVYPLFRGDSDPSTGAVGNYFRQGCHPNIPPLSSQSSAVPVYVQKVEDKLSSHLERQGLGLPFKESWPLRGVLDDITINQGGFLQGASLECAVDEQVKVLAKMIADLPSETAPLQQLSTQHPSHVHPTFIPSTALNAKDSSTDLTVLQDMIASLRDELDRLRIKDATA